MNCKLQLNRMGFMVLGLLLIYSNFSFALTAQEVYKKVKNSIYTLYSYSDETGAVKGRGTAVAVGKNVLVTNCHVALSGDYLVVRIDKKSKVVRLVYKNEKRDLCFLEVPRAIFSPVQIRLSNDVKIGESVYAIGNPRGTEKTLSKGIISNKHKVRGGVWLQTDAAINYGSSGGGLFDEDARLIGITSKMGGNFGFAIPTEWVLSVLAAKRNVLKEKNLTAAQADDWEFTPKAHDYSAAHANLKLLGTFGKNAIKLYRNNKECFIAVSGKIRGKNDAVSLALWNPKYPRNLVIFSGMATIEKALEELYKSIVDQRDKKPENYRSENILYLEALRYPMFGAIKNSTKYLFFVTQFDSNPKMILEKVKNFTVKFNSNDPRIGVSTVIFGMDGFYQALDAYQRLCVQ